MSCSVSTSYSRDKQVSLHPAMRIREMPIIKLRLWKPKIYFKRGPEAQLLKLHPNSLFIVCRKAKQIYIPVRKANKGSLKHLIVPSLVGMAPFWMKCYTQLIKGGGIPGGLYLMTLKTLDLTVQHSR